MLARGATKEGVALDEGGGDKGGSSLFKEVSTLKMKLMASTKRRTQAETSEKVLLKALRNADGDCDRLVDCGLRCATVGEQMPEPRDHRAS